MHGLRSFLEDAYGLDITTITPGPRQWVGETYAIETGNGDRLFVKLFHEGRLPHTTLVSLPVLAALHASGLTETNYPIPTRDGLFSAEGDDFTLVAFNFIDGVQTDEFDRRALGELIARVHRQTEQLQVPIERESFDPWFAGQLWENARKARELSGGDAPILGLQLFLREYADEIEHDWREFLALGEACRAADLDMVLTHGDAPWNVMHDGDGRLYLIDWDELLLAPSERDTWFFKSEPAFEAGYRRQLPDYVENDLAFRYYLYYRYFDELAAYARDILSNEPYELREKNLRHLYIANAEWLRPQIRALSARQPS